MNAEAELQPEARDFLRHYVTSHEQLKILLLMSEDESRWWTPDQLGRVVATEPQELIELLQPLANAGLLVSRGSPTAIVYRFSPERQEHVGTLAQLREASVVSPLLVLQAIGAHAIERIRADASRAFGRRIRRRQ